MGGAKWRRAAAGASTFDGLADEAIGLGPHKFKRSMRTLGEKRFFYLCIFFNFVFFGSLSGNQHFVFHHARVFLVIGFKFCNLGIFFNVIMTKDMFSFITTVRLI
jgi:hypothetical protein